MNKGKKIWLSSPHIGENELRYVNEAFTSNWIAPVGPHIINFEKKLSAISENFCVSALSSGTSAIHLALILSGVNRNDNVICSSFTFAASANPILYLGANPIFIDCEEQSWNMCPKLLENAIIDGINNKKKPKAIILVHLYGMPAKLDEIIDVANKYDVPVIEDAAEALGSKYNNKQVGTFGKFGIYSFNGNKIITTSAGGALICSDKNLVEKAKFLATQARDNAAHYEHSEIGYNYRMSNICAAIGLGQLDYLSARVKRKREIFLFYKEELSNIDSISFLEEYKNSFSNYWLTTALIKKDCSIDNDDLRLFLEKNNIESRPLWKPMHMQPIFKDCKSYENGVSKDLFNRGICLPSGTNMSDNDLKRIVHLIKNLYEA